MKKSPQCAWCAKGDEPAMLDKNGVLCSLSGTPGQLAHSYGDDWWPCPGSSTVSVAGHELNIDD